MHQQESRTDRTHGTGRDRRDGTGRDGTGRDGTERNGTERDGTGRNGTERDGTGRNGTERDETGRDGTGWDGTGRDRTVRFLSRLVYRSVTEVESVAACLSRLQLTGQTGAQSRQAAVSGPAGCRSCLGVSAVGLTGRRL